MCVFAHRRRRRRRRRQQTLTYHRLSIWCAVVHSLFFALIALVPLQRNFHRKATAILPAMRTSTTTPIKNRQKAIDGEAGSNSGSKRRKIDDGSKVETMMMTMAVVIEREK